MTLSETTFDLKMKIAKHGIIKIILIGQMLIIVYWSSFQMKPGRSKGTMCTEKHFEEPCVKANKLLNGERRDGGTSTETPTYRPGHTSLQIKNNVDHDSTNATIIQDQDHTNKELLSRIRDKCKSYMQIPYWQDLFQQGQVWTYNPKQIHYCIIPKVGCSFWKRILRFVSKDFPPYQAIKRPSDIDRYFVHYGPLANILKYPVHNPIQRMLMTYGHSFMFTRDPYSRLWSAYIDKFLLPDFWRTQALRVVRMLRPNSIEDKRKCASNVTFREFLTFINLTHEHGLNAHWDKIHRLCSPCHVQYDVIGKHESFGADVDLVLTKLNLEYLKENKTKLDMVKEEVATLTQYNFGLEKGYRQRKECFEKFDVARRLWLAFQYNGYIDRRTDFKKSEVNKTSFVRNPANTFIEYVFKTIDNQTKRGIDIKSQKRTMMLEEYKKIPNDLVRDVADAYEYDFVLFEYKKSLFPLTYKTDPSYIEN